MSKKPDGRREPEYVPIEKFPFVQDLAYRIQHSLLDYKELQLAGVTDYQFAKVRDKIKNEISKQVEHRIVDEKFAKDKNVEKVHKALLNYKPAGSKLKSHIKALGEVWDCLGLGGAYYLASTVLRADPDFVTDDQKDSVEAVYSAVREKFPQLFSEPGKYKEIVASVDKAYHDFEIMENLGIVRDKPRTASLGSIGQVVVPDFDAYEEERELLGKAVDASSMPELGEIERYLQVPEWRKYIEQEFSPNHPQRFEYVLSKKSKIKLTEHAASKIKGIAKALKEREAESWKSGAKLLTARLIGQTSSPYYVSKEGEVTKKSPTQCAARIIGRQGDPTFVLSEVEADEARKWLAVPESLKPARREDMLDSDELTVSAYKELEVNTKLRVGFELVTRNTKDSFADDVRLVYYESVKPNDIYPEGALMEEMTMKALPEWQRAQVSQHPIKYIEGTDPDGNHMDKFGGICASRQEVDKVLDWVLDANSKDYPEAGRRAYVRLKILGKSQA